MKRIVPSPGKNVVEVKGDNHAQFGNYSFQKGDPPAAIFHEDQQFQPVSAIMQFISRHHID